MEKAQPVSTESPPATPRDPFGTRHKLSNLIMIATALEQEADGTDTGMMVRILAVKVTGYGLLAIADVLGSLVGEVQQWRDWTSRRPPKPAKTTP